jgi:hypothetical protein
MWLMPQSKSTIRKRMHELPVLINPTGQKNTTLEVSTCSKTMSTTILIFHTILKTVLTMMKINLVVSYQKTYLSAQFHLFK